MVLLIVTVAAIVLFCLAAGTFFALLLDVLTAAGHIIMAILAVLRLTGKVKRRKPEKAKRSVYPPPPSRIDIKH